MDQVLTRQVFTLEVDGKATLSFPAINHQDAQSLLKEEWLRSDLRELKSAGAPLWDGRSKLSVRRADLSEAARFDREVKNFPAGHDADELPVIYHVALY